MKPDQPSESNSNKSYLKTETTCRLNNTKKRTSRNSSPTFNANTRTLITSKIESHLPQTTFFVKFGEELDNEKVLQKPRPSSYTTNLSEKFNAFYKHPNRLETNKLNLNLLGWDLGNNNSNAKNTKIKNDNIQLLQSFSNNFRQNECLEENSQYHERNNDRKYASVNPVVARIIEFMSKLNEHHECTSLGRLFDEKLQIIKLIYQTLRENYSISDTLALIPDHTEMNIERPLESLENDNQKKLTKKQVNTELGQENVILAIPSIPTPVTQARPPCDKPSTNLNIFDENFADDQNSSFFDNSLISCILNDRQCFIDEPEINKSDRAASIADQIPLVTTTSKRTTDPDDKLKVDSDFTIKSGQFAALLINAILKICFTSICRLDQEIKRYESGSISFNHVSKFAQDIQAKKLNSRRTRLHTEIRNLLPTPFAANKFIEFSIDEISNVSFYKFLVNFLNSNKMEFSAKIKEYDCYVRKFYAWFCQKGIADRPENSSEFILTMHDLICNLIFDVNNRQFHSELKRLEFILQPCTLYISDNVNLGKDPRIMSNKLKYVNSFVEIKQPYNILTILEWAPVEPGFDEKAYILSKYQEKLNEIKNIHNQNDCPPPTRPPPLANHIGSQLEISILPSTPVLKNFIDSFQNDLTVNHSESLILKDLSGEFDITQSSIPPTPELNSKISWINETNSCILSNNINDNNKNDMNNNDNQKDFNHDLNDDPENNKQNSCYNNNNKKSIFERLTASKTIPSSCPVQCNHSRSHDCSPLMNSEERASVFLRLGRSRLSSDEHDGEPERKRSRSFHKNQGYDSDDEAKPSLDILEWHQRNQIRSSQYTNGDYENNDIIVNQQNQSIYKLPNINPEYMIHCNNVTFEEQQNNRRTIFNKNYHDNFFHQNSDQK